MLQELHADSPHGPWAFVLSLTDWEHRGFTGGETVIFKPHMLDFWSSFEPARGFEFKDMVRNLLKALSVLFWRLSNWCLCTYMISKDGQLHALFAGLPGAAALQQVDSL